MSPNHFSLRAIVRPNILRLKPYRCARDDYSSGLLLDANENAYGPAIPSSLASALRVPPAPSPRLEHYPDPYQVELKSKIAQFRGLPGTDHLFLGVGSDEVIDLLFRVFCRPGDSGDKVLITPPTYGMYQVSADINDVGVVKVPLIVENGLFQLDTVKVLSTLDSDPSIKIVFICSPGNPTGSSISRNDILRILSHTTYRGIVVVDEAYIDFADQTIEKNKSCVDLVTTWDNLVVSQTLSKSFGLAGIRLGIAIASTELIAILNKTKAPYNISTPTSRIALSAFTPESLSRFRQNVASLVLQRSQLINILPTVPHISGILGTNNANFVLARFVNSDGHPSNEIAMKVYKKMAEELGVVVRFRGGELGCEGCLRITVGSESDNEVLLRALKVAVATVM